MPTFPLTPPSTPGYTDSQFGFKAAVAQTRSPFTMQRQAQAHQGKMLVGSVTLPPMTRAQAAQWIAFLVGLNGREGSFLIGDPDAKIQQGSWTTGTVAVAGTIGQGSLIVQMGGTKVAAAGDYFQLGTGTVAELHLMTQACTAGTSGTGTLVFSPPLRNAIGSSALLTLGTARGNFCLADNEQAMWSADNCSRFGLSFSFEEAF